MSHKMVLRKNIFMTLVPFPNGWTDEPPQKNLRPPGKSNSYKTAMHQ